MYINKLVEEPRHDYENVVGQDSITRFDKNRGQKNPRKNIVTKKNRNQKVMIGTKLRNIFY